MLVHSLAIIVNVSRVVTHMKYAGSVGSEDSMLIRTQSLQEAFTAAGVYMVLSCVLGMS